MKERRGISLVALIITIIVLIILTATLIIVFKDGGIIDKAKESTFRNDITVFKEELLQYVLNKQVETLNTFDKITLTKTTYNDIKEIIKSFTQKYENKVIIYKGEIVVDITNLDEKEIEWAEALNLSELSSEISNGIVPSEAKAIKNYRIYGNSVQNGTPTPTEPIEVLSLGENGTIDVISSGKNLFDSAFVGWIGIDGSISNSNNYSPIYTDKIPVNMGDVYTLSWNNDATGSNALCICSYDEYDNKVSRVVATRGTSLSIKITNVSATYIRASVMKSVINTDIQLEKGTVNSYEPYQEITTTINLTGHEPLRKIGDVADYIDYENEKLVRNIGKYIFTGNENFNMSDGTSTSVSFSCYTQSITPAPNVNGLYGLLNIGYVGTVSNSNYRDYNNCFIYNTNKSHFLKIEKAVILNWNESLSDDDKVNLFKAYLTEKYTAGTSVIVYYSLATPIEESIILPRLPDNTKEVQVISNGNIVPSNIEIEYYTEN